jgi:small conductance mechanosensitive channel
MRAMAPLPPAIVLAQSAEVSEGPGLDLEALTEQAPSTPGEALDVMLDQLGELWRSVLESLPVVLLGLVILAVAIALAVAAARAFNRTIERANVDGSVAALLTRIVRLVLFLAAVLFALSVMGVPVSSVLGLLAVAGLAVGLAIQGILENFIAGVILQIRRPIRRGEQVISGDYEGTVEDIDFRVTRLLTYDGTVVLIPNAQVYTNPLVNLTRRGKRRTTLVVGIDYRDDHDRARAVMAEALAEVEGVLGEPPSEVLLTTLGESSVDFELRYWTLPDIRSVRHTQDRVLSAVKTAVEAAGMTIPWPIRTLVVDGDSDIRLRGSGAGAPRVTSAERVSD